MRQLTLWSEPPPVVAHHHIESRYVGGFREITCTAGPRAPERKEWMHEAGYVGGATSWQECSICNPALHAQPSRDDRDRWKLAMVSSAFLCPP